MDEERFRKIDIDRPEKFRSIKLCNECGSGMTMNACEYLALFHPKIITLVKKISEKVKNFPEENNCKFPSMDCRNLCAAKHVANWLIQNLVKEDYSNSLLLIQELSKKITSISDADWVSGHHKYCNFCCLRFSTTCQIKNHLTLRHPECLALIQFLRCRPLSELNIQKDVVVLSKKNTQELIRQITSPTVLASRRAIVELEKLPNHLYQECLTKGYVKVTENMRSAQPLSVTQPNSNSISAEVMKKVKDIVENSPFPDKKNLTVILVPKKLFKTPQESSNSKRQISSNHKNVRHAVVPTTCKIIRYGVEDLKRDQLRKQQEKEKIAKKEKILRKMLAKYNEKETKKEVLYWQKMLSRYVNRHQKFLLKVEQNLINARRSGTSRLSRNELLEKVNCYVNCNEVKKAVIYLLKKLFEAMKKVPAVIGTKKEFSNKDSSSSENSFEVVDQSPKKKIHKFGAMKKASSVIGTKKEFSNKDSSSSENSFEIVDQSPKKKIHKFEAMKKASSVIATKNKLSDKYSSSVESTTCEIADQSIQQRIQTYFPLKDQKDKSCCIASSSAKKNLKDFSLTLLCKSGTDITDPFVDPTLITEDKQFFKCFCGKLNCVGLHPEVFY